MFTCQSDYNIFSNKLISAIIYHQLRTFGSGDSRLIVQPTDYLVLYGKLQTGTGHIQGRSPGPIQQLT